METMVIGTLVLEGGGGGVVTSSLALRVAAVPYSQSRGCTQKPGSQKNCSTWEPGSKGGFGLQDHCGIWKPGSQGDCGTLEPGSQGG